MSIVVGMITIVTHNGSFHADDVFAVAALQLLHGKENIQITRTRDESLMSTADYVVDVGYIYDHAQKRYDHHQPGAPVRENGIPYASFGLVWKHYGDAIAGSPAVAQAIEEKLCQPVDAGDNGITLYDLRYPGVSPFELYQFVFLFAPPWGSGESKDECFVRAVDWAMGVIARMCEKEVASSEMKKLVQSVYESAVDKRVLCFDVPVSAGACVDLEGVEVVVSPDDPSLNTNWVTVCVPKARGSFESRVYFPTEWAGLRGVSLVERSGIADAVFCHKSRMCITGSKASALLIAEFAK